MASSAETHEDKMVTGYPAPPNQVAAGYPAGTAYPYVFPPPPVSSSSYSLGSVGQSHQHHGRSIRNGPTVLCRLVMAAIAVISIMGLIFFITWLVLKPQLPEFRLDSASISSLKATGSELTANWDFTFFVRNPNHKLSIYYDRIEASVFYDGDYSLTTIQLLPFFQSKKNETTVRAHLGMVGEYVGQEIVEGISDNRALGSVSFGVKLIAWMRFRTGAWWMRQYLLRVNCDSVRIGFSSNNGTGTLMGQSKACKVDL